MSGTAALQSFPSAPVSIVAHDARGGEGRALIAADGAFQLHLLPGARYSLALDVGGREIPLVMARSAGRLDRSFRVSTANAAVRLGAVRYVAAGSAANLLVASTAHGCTGAATCVLDSPQTTCEGESRSDDTGRGDHGGDPQDGQGQDGAEQATPDTEMAVPDRDAPEDVRGCDSSVQEEGEH